MHSPIATTAITGSCGRCAPVSVLAMSGNHAFGQFLVAGVRDGVQSLLDCQVSKTRQVQCATDDALAELAAPALVAPLTQSLQSSIGLHVGLERLLQDRFQGWSGEL